MRTIRFRAKTLNEGEWVYGMTIGYGTIARKKDKLFMEVAPDKWKGVDPDTIGEYTGVDDVNGKPIFEGDIVETFSIYCAYRQVGNYPPPNVEVEEWEVKRSVNEVEFSYGSFNINGFPIMFEDMASDGDEADKSFGRREFEDMWEDNSYEIRDEYPYLTWDYFCKPHIIGNIHDNAQLLEGGDSDGED